MNKRMPAVIAPELLVAIFASGSAQAAQPYTLLHSRASRGARRFVKTTRCAARVE